MGKVSIGIVLGELVRENNLSASQLAKRLGKTRQTVYGDLKRTSMPDDIIIEYAQAMGIDKQLIYDRLKGITPQEPNPDYLQDYLKTLEDKFDRLINQLEKKDEQIKGLQRTVDVLLGKSRGVSIEPVCARESHSKKGVPTPFFMPFKRKFGYTPSSLMVAGSF